MRMNLYHVQDDDRPMYVVARDFPHAIAEWQKHIGEESGLAPYEVVSPAGVALVCTGDELLTESEQSEEIIGSLGGLEHARTVSDALPRTADGVVVTPGMSIWKYGKTGPAKAQLRAEWDGYPIAAIGWGMNVAGSEVYSTQEAAIEAFNRTVDRPGADQ